MLIHEHQVGTQGHYQRQRSLSLFIIHYDQTSGRAKFREILCINWNFEKHQVGTTVIIRDIDLCPFSLSIMNKHQVVQNTEKFYASIKVHIKFDNSLITAVIERLDSLLWFRVMSDMLIDSSMGTIDHNSWWKHLVSINWTKYQASALCAASVFGTKMCTADYLELLMSSIARRVDYYRPRPCLLRIS